MDNGKLNNFILYHIYCSQDRWTEAVGIEKKGKNPPKQTSKKPPQQIIPFFSSHFLSPPKVFLKLLILIMGYITLKSEKENEKPSSQAVV